MSRATDFLGRVAAVAALLGLAACPTDEPDDGEADTDVTGLTLTTTTAAATTTSASTADESSSGPTDPGTDVDYTTDIQPIWVANCVDGCHEPGGIYEALDLSSAFMSHTALTLQKPAYSTEDNFVVAGDFANSFLIDALRHPAGTIVRQMPLLLDDSVDPPVGVAGTPLPDNTILLVEVWIQRGADP